MEKLVTLSNGKEILIRNPRIADAEGLLSMLQDSVASTNYLLLTPEETNLTIEQEREWLSNVLSDNNMIMLVATHNNKIIGNTELRIGSLRKQRHWATLGITIVEKWRNMGLGTKLLNTLIELAKENDNIEIIALEVFADNKQAIALYEKLGFKKEAQIKNAFKLPQGRYINNIIMTLRIK